MAVSVPVAKDWMQKFDGILDIPEIRVWCHPHKIKEEGDDYYKAFPSFKEAVKFIATHPEAEDVPLLAFRGYEMNLWAVEALDMATF
mgnify:CR=1 FL=1